MKLIKLFFLFYYFIIYISYPINSFNIVIGYFNPDVGAPSTEIVKASSYYFKSLDENINITFQPILKLEAIPELLSDSSIDYLIISPIFIEYLGSNSKIFPLLSSWDSSGKNIYSKFVISKKNNIKSIEEISKKIVASSSYGKFGDTILNNFIFTSSPIKTDNVELVWVKKDLDAIFALIFGQVDAAIVSPICLKIINEEKPEYASLLNIIHKSKEMPFPNLYSNENFKNNKVIEQIFLQMNTNESGRNLLDLLGINYWKTIGDL